MILLLSVYVLVRVLARSPHPLPVALEVFAFIFLYAGLYENMSGVQGSYTFGRSLVMLGDVPLTVPLIEIDVLLIGLWMLEKMEIPTWCKPIIIGLLGMLQDLSLDPLSIRQVFPVGEVVSGRWNWLVAPEHAHILNVPVFNFPGWMLIMLYATTFILLGRWWFKRSGFNPIVGWVYPFLALFLALLCMISPISPFLLWLGPFFERGGNIEWLLLAIHLAVPALLLLLFWKGRMRSAFDMKEDLPVFVVPLVLHLLDIVFTIVGGHDEILALVLGVSAIHAGLLLFVYSRGRKLILEPAVLR